MPQPEEIPQRNKHARLLGIVPRDAEQAFAVVIRLCHPDMGDLPGSTDIGKDTRLARLDAPGIRVASADIPRREATGLSILDAREFLQHGVVPFCSRCDRNNDYRTKAYVVARAALVRPKQSPHKRKTLIERIDSFKGRLLVGSSTLLATTLFITWQIPNPKTNKGFRSGSEALFIYPS